MSRKPYQQPQSATWWLENSFFRFYMLREATSIPVFLYALWLMAGLFQLHDGAAAFNSWIAASTSPLGAVLHLVVFAAAVLHAYTWFLLTPKILVIRLGSFRVPDSWVKAGHYGVWVVVSAWFLWLTILG